MIVPQTSPGGSPQTGSDESGAELTFARSEHTLRVDGAERRVLRFISGGPRPAHLEVPAVVAERYEIEGVLTNSGGQGTIYRARDRRLAGRNCLIKAIRYTPTALQRAVDGSPGEVEEQRNALERECGFLTKMQLRGESRVPNLLRLEYDLLPALMQKSRNLSRDLLSGEPYLVMQHVPGVTLKTVIAQVREGNLHGGLESRRWWRVSLQLIRELCSILSALHEVEEIPHGQQTVERGFFYGDLKADNVIVTGGEFPTLIDFGGVRAYWRATSAPNAPWASESDTVFSCGYVAPEMADSAYTGELDPRVDVYSTGALLWHMLTGQSPARLTPTPSPTLSAQDPRLPAELPPYVRELLRDALERDRDKRTVSASALRQRSIQALLHLSQGN